MRNLKTLEQRIMRDLYTYFRLHTESDFSALLNKEMSSSRLTKIARCLLTDNYCVRQSPHYEEVVACLDYVINAVFSIPARGTAPIVPDTLNGSTPTTSQEEV